MNAIERKQGAKQANSRAPSAPLEICIHSTKKRDEFLYREPPFPRRERDMPPSAIMIGLLRIKVHLAPWLYPRCSTAGGGWPCDHHSTVRMRSRHRQGRGALRPALLHRHSMTRFWPWICPNCRMPSTNACLISRLLVGQSLGVRPSGAGGLGDGATKINGCNWPRRRTLNGRRHRLQLAAVRRSTQWASATQHSTNHVNRRAGRSANPAISLQPALTGSPRPRGAGATAGW